MGNTCKNCCNNHDANLTQFNNIDQFYNPFYIFNKNMIFDRNKIDRHGPGQGLVIDEIPRKLTKLQNDINTKYPQNNLKLDSDSLVLRTSLSLSSSFLVV